MHENLAAFPDFRIFNRGVYSKECLERELTTFHEFCRWLQDLPYGRPHDDSPISVFTEGIGTCSGKHGSAAMLAFEQGCPIYKYAGFYRLDSTTYDGAHEILDDYGLNFVPHYHCILGHDTKFIDLTEGNCTGKKKAATSMDVLFRVPAIIDDTLYLNLLAHAVGYFGKEAPELLKYSVEDLRDIAAQVCVSFAPACAIR